MLDLLLPFQRFFIPGLILLVIWAVSRTVINKDRPVGLVLYLSLIIIVDSFLNTGIYIPGLKYGSIRYSEVLCFFLLLQAPKAKPATGVKKLILSLIVIYFILFFYAALRGQTLENGMQNFRRLMIPQILAACVAYKGFIKKEDYYRFFFYFMILIIIISLFTFWDVFFDRWLLKSEILHKHIYYGSRSQGRFGSFFLNPNFMGGFCVLMLPVMCLLAVKQESKITRIFYLGGLLLFLFALIKTQSRGPLIGFAVAMLSFIFIPTKKYPFFRKIGSLILLISVLALFLPGFYKASTGRFSTMEKEYSHERVSRLSIWEFTMNNLIVDYPLFGIGLGESKYIKAMYDYGYRAEFGRTLDNPHSSYIQIAVMAGCVTLFIFILVNMIIICKNISFIRRNGDDDISLILLGLTSGLIGFLFCLIVDMQLFVFCVAPVYWVTLCLSFSISSSDSLIQNHSMDTNSI